MLSNKSLGVSIKDLADFDDIATFTLLDCYLDFRTHKMNTRFRKLRGKQSQFLEIVLDFIQNQDKNYAMKRLFNMPWADDKFMATKDALDRKERCKQYLSMFIDIYRPDSGISIQKCTRYSLENHVGAKIIVTRVFHSAETIEYLQGVLAELSPADEESFLVPGKNDFSVMYSYRKNKAQLWLGPAAFLNHDCDPTCRFNLSSSGKISIVTKRRMEIGDEVTCFYGPSFFGEKNANCECLTCEKEKARQQQEIEYEESLTPSKKKKYPVRRNRRDRTKYLGFPELDNFEEFAELSPSKRAKLLLTK